MNENFAIDPGAGVLEKNDGKFAGFAVRKYQDHRNISLIMTVLTSLSGTSLWTWDYTIDPVGAGSTLAIRALIIPGAALYIYALYFRKNYRWAMAAATVMILGWEIGFIALLPLLKDGVIHGQAGFVYFFLIPLLLTRGLPFVFNLFLFGAVSILPFLAYGAGLLPGFPVLAYSQLVAPMPVLVLFAVYSMDVSYRKNILHNHMLEQDALLDPLTGVANRRKLDETILSYVSEGKNMQAPFSVLTLDIDDFKKINDSYGHAYGDLIIKEIATACRDSLRSGDIVSRTGGEEFVVTLPGAAPDVARSIAERLRESITKVAVPTHDGRMIRCTVSIGVATDQLGRTTFEKLLESGDTALYRAKRNGKNQVQAFGDMDPDMSLF